MEEKITIEYVKAQFAKDGYVLLSDVYTKSKIKLNYICPKGHKHYVTWSDWKNKNSRCPHCSKKAKPNIDFIRETFKANNYILVSSVYVNCKSKLVYICNNGHRHSISWNNWKRGVRCPYCSGQAKHSIKTIRQSFKDRGYTLLSKEYKNSKTKLKYVCPEGHYHSISWNTWRQGQGCSSCGNVKIGEKLKKDFNIIKRSFESFGYSLLSKQYINSKHNLEYVCPLGHCGSISWNNWDKGHRCPTCHRINFFGSGNPSWKGGISYEPYCPIWSDKEFKESIKVRDGFKCLNPACNSKNSNDLTIHHIDYNKKNCSPSNLITVCRSCNSKANSDRKWHRAWYGAIIKNRYSC